MFVIITDILKIKKKKEIVEVRFCIFIGFYIKVDCFKRVHKNECFRCLKKNIYISYYFIHVIFNSLLLSQYNSVMLN